ncbi:MAG: hypothetical protein JXA52_10505 [Planctomycetes bacterium]|nr:hypothetical protein [Planctomycetota bacterium]
MAEALAPELLKILVCPLTKKPLVQAGDWLVCTDTEPQRRYPIRDGIPVMLVDEAEILAPDGNWTKASAKAEGTD